MKSNKQDLTELVETQDVKKYSFKRDLLEKSLIFAVFANVMYATVSYGWRSEGMTEESINFHLCVRHYDSERGEYVPFKIRPVYWLTTPGRELGYYLYDKFPDVFPAESKQDTLCE